MARIDMGNGERITLNEFNRRRKMELKDLERQWHKKFKKPEIVQILKRAEKVLKRRLTELLKELKQLEIDGDALSSVEKIHEQEMGWKLDMEAGGQHFCPFFIHVYHHTKLRENLEERIDEYKVQLQQIKRLQRGHP